MADRALTAAGIGLVDIDAIDADDGGLNDEGIDRAKFPTPPGH